MRGVAATALLSCLLISTVAAQTDPSTAGEWSGPVSLPIVTIHTQVLPDGKLMGWGNGATPPLDGRANVRLWDPAAERPVFEEVPNPYVDVYCVGHTLLPDGRVLAIGGHIQSNVGSDATTTFDHVSRTWTNGQRMSAGRWYPSATVLANGDVLTTSGDVDTTVGVNTLPQVYQTSSGTWRDLTNAQLSLPLYPWMHLAPNGKVFMSGPGQVTRYLDTDGSGQWTTVALTNFGDRREYQGTSVMYEPGKVLILGGSNPATATAEVIDLNAASPQWRYTNPMSFARRAPNATLLPDGKVLVTGGSSSPIFNDPSEAIYNAEIWDPATENWSTMAAMRTSRLYHSTAVLLPDGRVYVSGGGGGGGEAPDIDHYDAEFFSPPYLFKGPRPTIDSAPASAGYGEQFTIDATDATGIASVTLVALSSTTHEFNMSQRFIRLAFSRAAAADRYNVSAPNSPNLAPPGYYMMFVLNGNGVPSVAHMLRIRSGAAAENQAPVVNAGADRTVTLPSGVTLSGSASDDGQPGPLTTTWSQVSGPGTVSFGNASALSTTASFPAAGVYVLRLRASDGVLASTDDVTVTVHAAAGGNGLAGQYYNGINFNTLVFTRIDPTVNFSWGHASPGPGVQVDGFSVRWTGQVQAPVSGTYIFSTVSNDGVRLYVNGQLVINNWTVHGTTTDSSAGIALEAGVRYPITMEYFERSGWGESRLRWAYPGQAQTAIPQSRLFAAAATNQPPVVDAGADRTVTLPSGVTLTGTASDDGQPGPLTTTWSQLSGPGAVSFGNMNALSTSASFPEAGVYVLRLRASDGALASTDDVTVTVQAAPPNQAPVVSAGADVTVTLPSGATLSGTASDDGQPGPLTTTWTQVSGPGAASFGNVNALSTSASFPTAGVYVLRLLANDGALTSSDDLTVTVQAATITGTGLTGRYYNGINFNSLVFTRIDPTVNFSWGHGSPGAGVQLDGFSIRWTGEVEAPVTGTYTFSTVSNDGVRLFVNGQLVVNNWTVHGTTTNTSTGIALQAGVRYAITMEYFENSGWGESRLLWAYPGQAQTVIPRSRLFP